MDPERWEFANEEFIRGHMHLLKNIHRRKPVHSHSPQTQVNHGPPLADSERREFEEEIGRLRHEKCALLADLQRQAQQQLGITWLMQSLEERLVVMEQRQQNIVASMREMVQRRRQGDSGVLETDHFSKKRRVPKIDFFAEELAVEEQPYLQTTGDGTTGMCPVNAEPFEKMELALASLENLFQKAGNYAPPQDMYSSVAGPVLALGDLQTASTDNSVNLQPPPGLDLSSPDDKRHADSPPELLESPGYVQSPLLVLPDIDDDNTRKATAEADMSSEVSTTDTSQDEMTAETGASQEPVATNDLFWERFLSETPKFTRLCWENSDGDCKRETTESKEEVRIGIDRNWFDHRGNVEEITDQMGHLASNEKT